MSLLQKILENKIKTGVDTNTLMHQWFSDYVESQDDPKLHWDGMIHPSSLDWSAKPEAQFSRMINKHKHVADTLKRFRLGNIIHKDFEKALHEGFFGGKGQREDGIRDERTLFQGTPDIFGPHPILGNVLFELKSVSTYQRDKKTGESLLKKIQYPDDLAEKLMERLCVGRKNLDTPASDHLTQGFTYVWALSQLCDYQIDWLCILYLHKDAYTITEFWYKIDEHRELLKKAKANYTQVYKLAKDELRERAAKKSI